MEEKEILKIGDMEVVLDPDNLKFNETTLNEYIQKESAYYDNFGASLAKAERVLQLMELKCDTLYQEKFSGYKESGAGSDRLCEAKSKSDEEYIKAKGGVINAKYKVKRLQLHLRAWDKNHDNAQSLGHMLRKEMDKLNSDIRSQSGGGGGGGDFDFGLDQKLDETITPIESE